MKDSLHAKLLELEEEKAKLRSLQVIPNRYSFEEMFLVNCGLKNSSVIPATRRQKAEKVSLIDLLIRHYQLFHQLK